MSSLSEAIAFALQGAAVESAQRPSAASTTAEAAIDESVGGATVIADASGTTSDNASSSGGSTSTSGNSASHSSSNTSASGTHGGGAASSSGGSSAGAAAAAGAGNGGGASSEGAQGALSAALLAVADADAGRPPPPSLREPVHFQSDRDELPLPTLVPLIAELISATAAKNSFRHGRELATKLPTMFHAPDFQIPRVTIFAFLDRMATYMGCSSNCFVLALVIIDALVFKRGSDVRYLLVPSSMHRLVLGSVVLAIKFLEDSFRSNRFYAKVGGIDVGEFNRIESLLVYELDYELLSIASHFHRYSERLHYLIASSAAARAVQPNAPPTWHIDLRTFFSFSERRLLRSGSSNDLVFRLRSQRMAGTATALAQHASRDKAPNSSVAALVGSPKPRHGSLRASSSSTAASKRSGSPPSGAAKGGGALHTMSLGATPLKTGSASPKGNKLLRAVSSSSFSRATAPPAAPGIDAAAAPLEPATAAATTTTTTTVKRTSPVSLVRASRSPTSELDRAVKLNRVQSTELTIDVFRTRAAPPARRISSSPAQLGPGGGGRVIARSQLSMISTVVSTTTADRRKRVVRRHVSLDDVRRHQQQRADDISLSPPLLRNALARQSNRSRRPSDTP